MLTPHKTISVPQQLGIKLSYLAEQLDCTNETLLNNIKRDPKHRLYLKAFKIGPKEYRVNWEDAVDFIRRNTVGVEINLQQPEFKKSA
ncbi:hypothetical protein CLV24_11449 [Pontibacter ummariensis]|uniref:Uncharacterized protein n=1 Tax=Pontibacter ummariensis TaxID=1610492 RepID=A0A239HMW2_9BACT|nr:hypothetical protein [Pontibacter ummariensis]PRY10321.1 hypothetical protein CLV24_11449 [Pontibacter ummariensis]SNS82183.1 hypothetical protein SAMN06296052_11449 [Pontibacter ummariensis]